MRLLASVRPWAFAANRADAVHQLFGPLDVELLLLFFFFSFYFLFYKFIQLNVQRQSSAQKSGVYVYKYFPSTTFTPKKCNN